MATRLRTILMSGGAIDGGGWARIRLEGLYSKLVGPAPVRGSVPEAQRLVSMYKGLPEAYRGSLFLFREPRTVSLARSRWKQLSRYYGIPPRKPKKKFVGVLANARNIRRAPEGRPRAGRIPLPPRNREVRFWNPDPLIPGNRGNRVAPGGDVPPQGGVIGGLADLGGQAAGEMPRWNANGWFNEPDVAVPQAPVPPPIVDQQEIVANIARRAAEQQVAARRFRWEIPARGNNDEQW